MKEKGKRRVSIVEFNITTNNTAPIGPASAPSESPIRKHSQKVFNSISEPGISPKFSKPITSDEIKQHFKLDKFPIFDNLSSINLLSKRSVVNLKDESPFLTQSYTKQLLANLVKEKLEENKKKWFSEFFKLLDIILNNLVRTSTNDEKTERETILQKMSPIFQKFHTDLDKIQIDSFSFNSFYKIIGDSIQNKKTVEMEYDLVYIQMTEALQVMKDDESTKKETIKKACNALSKDDRENEFVKILYLNHTELTDLATHSLIKSLSFSLPNDTILIKKILEYVHIAIFKVASTFKKEEISTEKSSIATIDKDDGKDLMNEKLFLHNDKMPTLFEWLKKEGIVNDQRLYKNETQCFICTKQVLNETHLRSAIERSANHWLLQEERKLNKSQEIKQELRKTASRLHKKIDVTKTYRTVDQVYDLLLTLLCYPEFDILYKNSKNAFLDDCEALINWISSTKVVLVEFKLTMSSGPNKFQGNPDDSIEQLLREIKKSERKSPISKKKTAKNKTETTDTLLTMKP